MSLTTDRIVEVIYQSIDEINEQLPAESWLRKEPGAPLLSSTGGLDSLGFITFVALVEEKCDAKFGVMLSLADAQGSDEDANPFATVTSLTVLIESLLAAR